MSYIFYFVYQFGTECAVIYMWEIWDIHLIVIFNLPVAWHFCKIVTKTGNYKNLLRFGVPEEDILNHLFLNVNCILALPWKCVFSVVKLFTFIWIKFKNHRIVKMKVSCGLNFGTSLKYNTNYFYLMHIKQLSFQVSHYSWFFHESFWQHILKILISIYTIIFTKNSIKNKKLWVQDKVDFYIERVQH